MYHIAGLYSVLKFPQEKKVATLILANNTNAKIKILLSIKTHVKIICSILARWLVVYICRYNALQAR